MVVSIALLGATLSPLVRSPHDDAFPLSTYPMFAIARPTTLTLTYAIAIGRGDVRHAIRPELVGSGEPLQAMAILETAMRSEPAARALCEQIAGRVARDHDFDDATQVRIIWGTHEAVAYLVRHEPGIERERVRCEVPR